MFDPSKHTPEQRRSLQDGFSIMFLSWGFTITALIVAGGLSLVGFEAVAKYLAGWTIVLFGGLGGYGLSTGLAGYFNDANS